MKINAQLFILTLLAIPSAQSQEDLNLEKYINTYNKWSEAMYSSNTKIQQIYQTEELNNRFDRLPIKPTAVTFQKYTCDSYLVSHSISKNEFTKYNINADLGLLHNADKQIILNIFNECKKPNSNSITHVSGITVNMNPSNQKISSFSIKTHKNNKNGLSESNINKAFDTFTSLTQPYDPETLKQRDFSEDINRLKKQQYQ